MTLKRCVGDAERVGFALLGSDFMRLHAFDAAVELRWPNADVVCLQWLHGLVWERDSLADSAGGLRPWMLLCLIGGPYFTLDQLRAKPICKLACLACFVYTLVHRHSHPTYLAP